MTGYRTWARVAALGVVAPAAAFGSFTGLSGLAERCGWGDAAPLLPVALDGYAAYAWLLALSPVPVPTRRVARVHAWTAITASATGNAVERYLTADLLATHWLVVVATGAVPALVFGAVCHLAARDQPQVVRRAGIGTSPASQEEFGTALPSQGDAKLRKNPDLTRVVLGAGGLEAVPAGGGGDTADTGTQTDMPAPTRVNADTPPGRAGTSANRYSPADIDAMAEQATAEGIASVKGIKPRFGVGQEVAQRIRAAQQVPVLGHVNGQQVDR